MLWGICSFETLPRQATLQLPKLLSFCGSASRKSFIYEKLKISATFTQACSTLCYPTVSWKEQVSTEHNRFNRRINKINQAMILTLIN